MKKLALVLALYGMCAGGAAHAATFQNDSGLANRTYVDTFDSPPLPNYTPAGSFFAGMTFSNNLFVTTDYDGSYGSTGQSIVNRFSSIGCCSNPSSVSFASAITDVGFLFASNPTTVGDLSTFSAFRNNVLVESFSAHSGLTNSNRYYGFTGISFDRIEFNAGGANKTYVLDNMQFAVTPVPEPEIYAMMAIGLGLMGFVARRRKQKEITAT